jgi:transposase-like protein
MSHQTSKPRVRYTPDVVDTIIHVLEMGGTDSDAATAAGVNRNTFYLWRKKHPEFKERIEAAKAGVNQSAAAAVLDKLEQCRSLAEDYILRVFRGEIERVKTRVDRTGAVIFRESEVVLPSDRMVERFLNLGAGEQTFNLNIGLAEPLDDELEDYEFSELSEPED